MRCFVSCRISTDKGVAHSHCNSTASCLRHSVYLAWRHQTPFLNTNWLLLVAKSECDYFSDSNYCVLTCSPRLPFAGGDYGYSRALKKIIFTLHLRRKPLYYIVNLIIPCCLLSLITLTTFLLPPGETQRTTIGTITCRITWFRNVFIVNIHYIDSHMLCGA